MHTFDLLLQLGPGHELDKDGGKRGFYLVTAAVDRLDMLHLMTPKNVTDLRLSGHVIYVGHSSMEVAVRMERLDKDGKEGETMMLGTSWDEDQSSVSIA